MENKASQIRNLLESAYQNVIEAGFELISVKESLDHGEWGQWVQDCVGIGIRTAEKCMASARMIDSVLGPSWKDYKLLADNTALYSLTKQDVPQDVKEKAVGLMVGGQRLTKPMVDSLIAGVEKATKTMVLAPHVSTRITNLIQQHNLEPGVIASLTILEQEMPEEFEEIYSSGVVYYGDDPVPLSEAGERDIEDHISHVRFETRMSKNGVNVDNVIPQVGTTGTYTTDSLNAPHFIATTSGPRVITILFSENGRDTGDLDRVVKSIKMHGGKPVMLIASFDTNASILTPDGRWPEGSNLLVYTK